MTFSSLATNKLQPQYVIPLATVSATTGSPTIDTSSRPGKTIYKFVNSGTGSITFGTSGTIEVLVVGGAGAGENGGRGAIAGGGGGGMVVYLPSMYVTAGTYSITRGEGASRASTWTGSQAIRECGGFSLFGGIYAAGGGGAGQSGADGPTGGSTNGKIPGVGIGQGAAMGSDATGITNSITGSSVLYGGGGQIWYGGSNTPSTGYSRVDGTGTGTGAHGCVIVVIG